MADSLSARHRMENRQRDQRVSRKLRRLGWEVLIVWECQIRDLERLEERLLIFLGK